MSCVGRPGRLVSSQFFIEAASRVVFPFNDEGQGFEFPSGLLSTRYEGLLEGEGVRDVDRALSRGTRRRVADRAPGVRTLFTMFAA